MPKADSQETTHDRSRAGPFRDPDTCQAVSTGSPPKAEILKATPLRTLGSFFILCPSNALFGECKVAVDL
jgi:hypothetical protein